VPKDAAPKRASFRAASPARSMRVQSLAPSQYPFNIDAQRRSCLIPASLLPCVSASPSSNLNSEKASSSASVKSTRISHFHFSNSEPTTVRVSNLQPLTSNLQNLPDTPRRIEPAVSHRKQTTAHSSTRHSSHAGCFHRTSAIPLSSSFQPRASSLRHPCISLLAWDITTPPDSEIRNAIVRWCVTMPFGLNLRNGWGKIA
jgi:hypothetical protein